MQPSTQLIGIAIAWVICVTTVRSVERIASPPIVQMFVPGFTVRELPVELPNVNNVLYRDDGVLVALTYDGNIHLLFDSNGDGLEDQQKLFWENDGQLAAPIGLDLTPAGYSHGRGVLVAGKGKCLLIVDTDGDDRADKEIAVATGWTELPHGVDALGAAFAPRDRAIFFGLGTANYTNPYLLNDEGRAEYRLDSERGTILRVSPDLTSREIFATGIRFPVAIRFHPNGDLFCTDQEGATWLPNGNPFDELLHVRRGRHYGFPPRHPRHLPDVIDEPSVVDYRPQHQSTCGLNFNQPTGDGTIFGPASWRSDAFITGYSRGKLYRSKLVRTDGGYVAQNQLVASLAMLPADACVAPGRKLLIAAHSGGPDWGSGPSGKGKLFKVTHSQPAPPTPAVIWAASPQEVRIAFDQPVDPHSLGVLHSRVTIEGGEFVAAGDRFEVLRPGYATVEAQQTAPRTGVDVLGIQLTADRRTLLISTAPHFAAVNYAVALHGIQRLGRSETAVQEVSQFPDIDLQYDLGGVETTWQPQAGERLTGWLPHLDLDVARAFTVSSAWHENFWRAIGRPGTMRLRTSLNLRDMLRPAVQPGSAIHYQLPAERVALKFESNCEFDLVLNDQATAATPSGNGKWIVECNAEVGSRASWPMEIRLHKTSDGNSPELTVSYYTQDDSRQRALPTYRFHLPWARLPTEMPVVVDNRSLPELAAGNWIRGQTEFFGSDAGCSKCHSVRGEGGTIGPDLSNLVKRDYASVVRDISEPSAAINPDFVSHVVVTTHGRVLTGTVRTAEDRLIVSDPQAVETVIPRDEVEEMQPTELSIMPEGIPKLLGPARMRDLLTFLLVDPPRMPNYGELPPPPPRMRSEVEAAWSDSETNPKKRPLRIVLVSGPKDHGIGEHDYPAWQTVWHSLLEMDESVRADTADRWPVEKDLEMADVLVFYQQGDWTPERARDIDRFLRRGGGLVYIHYAVDGGGDPAGFAERIGLAWQSGRSKFRHGRLAVEFVPGSGHPIARNLNRVEWHDESYWNLIGAKDRINLLATGIEEDQPRPLFWTVEPERGGRIFVSIPGHFAWTFDDPIFRLLLLRGIAWTAKEPVDRFNQLVLPGARVATAAP